MMKLWKARVNAWGWDHPCTIYAESREEAERLSSQYPAASSVEYAGRFRDLYAEWLLGKISQSEYEEKGGKW